MQILILSDPGPSGLISNNLKPPVMHVEHCLLESVKLMVIQIGLSID